MWPDLDREQLDSLGARVRQIRGHHPLVLEDPDLMWLVVTGSAVLLTSRVDNGLPVGSRRFLFNAGVGTSLFPVSDGRSGSAPRLIVQSNEPLTLIEAPLQQSERLLAIAGLRLAEAIEAWVSRLSAFTAAGRVATVADRLPGAGELELPSGTRVRAAHDAVAWLQVREGALNVLDNPSLRIDPQSFCMPVGSELWMEAVGKTRIQVCSAAQFSDEPELTDGLVAFNGLLQEQLTYLETADLENEARRLARSAEQESRVFATAMEHMASVLHPKRTIPARETALLTAATMVGDALGIEIHPPARSENMQLVEDPIEAIARASRVRHRKVLLSREWWKSDCGPLIAYCEEDDRPVALMRNAAQAYEIFDPASGEYTPVNHETALDLAPEAVMLYRRLPTDTSNVWQIARWSLRGRASDVAFIIVLSIVTALIGMLVPQATAMIMDNAIPDANRYLLMELGLVLAAAAFGTLLFGVANGITTIRIGVSVDAVSQAAVFDRLFSLRVPVFRRFTTGDLLERAMAISQVNQELNGQTLRSLLNSVMAILNLALLYYYNSLLAMMALGMGVLIAVVSIGVGIFVRRYYRQLMELQGHFFGFVVELVGAVNKIRVAGGERRAFAQWVNRYTEQLSLMLKAQELEDYITVFNQIIPIISAILLYWLGVEFLAAGLQQEGAEPALTVGVFLAFNVAMGVFLNGITSLSSTALALIDTLAKAERVKPLLEAETEIEVTANDPGRLVGGLSLAGVHFRYVDGGPKILEDVTIRAHPEEFVAIVGPSGSGKSTIFRLLLGFEKAESGVVAYDGQDVSGLDITAVRRQLGVVLQSSRLGAGSIFDNITVGMSVTSDEAWAAAKDAGFDDDIHQMPMKMHTVVSEGGTNLSGGQRQRLLIARALVKKPKILLFDEATSALDNQTQAIVSESLERRKVTRVVIAHRLSTIRSADRIYVLDKGRVAEVGAFDELIGRKGVFSSMMARQIT